MAPLLIWTASLHREVEGVVQGQALVFTNLLYVATSTTQDWPCEESDTEAPT